MGLSKYFSFPNNDSPLNMRSVLHTIDYRQTNWISNASLHERIWLTLCFMGLFAVLGKKYDYQPLYDKYLTLTMTWTLTLKQEGTNELTNRQTNHQTLPNVISQLCSRYLLVIVMDHEEWRLVSSVVVFFPISLAKLTPHSTLSQPSTSDQSSSFHILVLIIYQTD